jgi:predicted RNase H-like nuclease
MITIVAMSNRQLHHGAPLPYRLLAGVEPFRKGWLVISGKLHGVSMLAEPAQSMGKMIEILDYRPSFEIVALHSPIGLPNDSMRGGRKSDREARRILGAKRGTAIGSPPPRSALHDADFSGLSAIVRGQLPRIREVQRDVASYHQRVVFEVHPELAFYQLNGEEPLKTGRSTKAGFHERYALLEHKLNGIDRVFANPPEGVVPARLLDACANLWTARRIAAKAVSRVPEMPEWNDDGLRMEYVY